MSVAEGLSKGVVSPRRQGGAVLIFMPALIALIGLAAIYLGNVSRPGTALASGYGIDEVVTGSIGGADSDAIITFDR